MANKYSVFLIIKIRFDLICVSFLQLNLQNIKFVYLSGFYASIMHAC